MSPIELRTLRSLSGLGIYDFARRLGCGKTTIQRYESGAVPIPPAFVARVERTFGLDAEKWRLVWEAAVAIETAKASLSAVAAEEARAALQTAEGAAYS